MRRRNDKTVLMAGMALVIGVATGCQPPPPTPTLTVTTHAAGPDAESGDGMCEATAGLGDCTLQAAVDEGIALGRAAIVVPASPTEYPAITGVVTGSLSIAAAEPDATEHVLIDGLEVGVDTDGVLTFKDVDPGVGSIAVRGSLVLDRSTIVRNPVPLRILAGGKVVLRNTLVYGRIENEGTLAVTNSTLATDRGTILATTGAGATHLTATALLPSGGPSDVPTCTGTAPVSHGYNVATDTSCSLTQVGDDQTEADSQRFPGPLSARIDAIPVGTAGCGTLLVDIRAHPRPADGDGDGDPRCDIGAWERDRPAAP